MLDKALPQQTVRYLSQVIGGEAVRLASARTAELTYFLQETYDVLTGELLGQPITLACVKGRQPLAAQQISQHTKLLRELLDNPLCCRCQAKGVLQPAKVVDHIVPVKLGGERFERANLQSLCVPCHNAKTASETASLRNQAPS